MTGYYRMSSCRIRERRLDYTRGYDFKTALTSQLNRNNLLKAGVQYRYDKFNLFYTAIDPSVNGGNDRGVVDERR